MKVGDLALVTGSKFYPERIGQTVQIVEPYALRWVVHPNGSRHHHFRYVVVYLCDGVRGAYSYRNLMPLDGVPESKAPRLEEVSA